MNTLVVVGLFLSLAISLINLRKIQDLKRRISMVSDLVGLTQTYLYELEEKTEKELSTLRLDIRKRAGEVKFSGDMKISEIIAAEPRARDIFASFHLGGCDHCAINEDDSLEEVARSNGIHVERLLEALERGRPYEQQNFHDGLTQIRFIGDMRS
ncbi:MAG: hypothetical protein HY731_13310 [Candidatus Tectomicrobia bacterium]|nr:hypothetical protein [Candidatus Tectomicrobia bacterium]